MSFRTAALAALTVAIPAAGQRPVPLTAILDLRLDAAIHDFSPIPWLLAGRDGSLFVAQPQDRRVLAFDARGNPRGAFGATGEGPGEFRRLGRAGWYADTLWIADGALPRMTLVSPALALLRTIPTPREIPPPGGDTTGRARMGAALGPLPDGGHLVMGMLPLNPATPRPAWAAGARSPAFLARVLTGRPTRIVAWVPEDPCGLSMTPVMALCARPLAEVAPDGRQVAFATTTPDGAVTVTLLDARGDTTFTRRIPTSPEPVPARMLDSLRARSVRSDLPAGTPNTGAPPAPKYLPPVERLVLGRDGTVWVVFRPRVGAARRDHLALDPSGRLLGVVALPVAVKLLAASRSTLWGTERDADDVESVVRFAIRPAAAR